MLIDPKSLRTISLATLIPMYLCAGPLIGFWIGSWLDDQFGSDPFGLIIMIGLGFLAGIRQSLLTIKELNKNE